MARILIVEDDQFFRAAIATVIEDFGHAVTLAGNGKEASEKLLTGETYDIILSDLQMPVMGGLALVDWVKKNRPTPLILMTGFEPNINTTQAINLGAENILFKPFKAEEARRAIDLCLSRHQVKVPEHFYRVPIELVRSGDLDVNIYVIHRGQIAKIRTRGEGANPHEIPALQKPDGLEFFTEMENREQVLSLLRQRTG